MFSLKIESILLAPVELQELYYAYWKKTVDLISDLYPLYTDKLPYKGWWGGSFK